MRHYGHTQFLRENNCTYQSIHAHQIFVTKWSIICDKDR